jgi:hypothetical protein
MKNYYQILGISQTAGELEIRKAYRRLVRQYHPDINSSPEAPEQFRAVQEAYEVLMDTEKRHHYDTWGATKPTYEAHRAPAEDPKEAKRREYRKWRAAQERERDLARAIMEFKYRRVLRWVNLAVASLIFLMLVDVLLPASKQTVRGVAYYQEEYANILITREHVKSRVGPYMFMVPIPMFRHYTSEPVEVERTALLGAPIRATCTLRNGDTYFMERGVLALKAGHLVLWILLACSLSVFLDTAHTEPTHILGYLSVLGLLVTGVQLLSMLLSY